MPYARMASLQEAVSSIPDDACIALGGFDIVRAPMSLVFELARRAGKRLEVVSPPNPLAIDLLIGVGSVRRATLAFSGFQFDGGFAVGPMVKKAVEDSTIEYREVDAYAILTGLRAAAMGVPFLPLPDVDGSELDDPDRWNRVTDPFTGTPVIVTRPIQPDVALVHAQLADRNGNLYIEDPIVDELVAKAARRVIASAERIVEQVSRPTIPFYLVESLVEAPHGAWPCSCAGAYPADHEHIRLYLRLAGEGRFEDYRREFIERSG